MWIQSKCSTYPKIHQHVGTGLMCIFYLCIILHDKFGAGLIRILLDLTTILVDLTTIRMQDLFKFCISPTDSARKAPYFIETLYKGISLKPFIIVYI